MPLLKNAKKALRVSRRKTEINRRVKSQVKTAVDAMKQNPTQENLNIVFSKIDIAAKKNIFHRNKAARHKRQMSALLSPAAAK